MAGGGDDEGVEADAALLQLARDVGVRGRALEQQVLQQVRHTGFAIVLVARTHQIRDVHRDGVLRGIGKQQYLQPVIEVCLPETAGDEGL